MALANYVDIVHIRALANYDGTIELVGKRVLLNVYVMFS
jgi:hypothetical protein